MIDDRLLDAERDRLRGQAREARDAITGPERLRRSELAAARLDALEPFRTAGTILFYYPVGSQLPTVALIRRLVEDEGRRVLLPFMRAGELQVTEWRPADPVVDAAYTGMEPRFKQAVPEAGIDLAVVPGLAFDPEGHRLGEGAGHHDRLLARLRPDAVTVGLGYEEQVLPALPHGPEDRTLGFVVTDDRTLACPPRA